MNDETEEAVDRFEAMEADLQDLIAFKRRANKAFVWLGGILGTPMVILIWEFITDV